ncbi:MAG: hypothetical protein AUG00_08205 [Candidatus Rokubacteria bacterium 13_1_20CM_2_70_7]|nr:MAG: hypothetical protein AUG00_08205 [Candidatus Rokubacteria bacterium 13_1_20CM_2_70_7]
MGLKISERLLTWCLVAVATLAPATPAAAADYAGPLIDAHSHVPNATAVEWAACRGMIRPGSPRRPASIPIA